MQHLEGSGMPVLYIGRMALKGYRVKDSVTSYIIITIITSGRISNLQKPFIQLQVGYILYPEDGGSSFFKNTGSEQVDFRGSRPKR